MRKALVHQRSPLSSPLSLAAGAEYLQELAAGRTTTITTLRTVLEAAARPPTVHQMRKPTGFHIREACSTPQLLAIGTSPCPRKAGQLDIVVSPTSSILLAQRNYAGMPFSLPFAHCLFSLPVDSRIRKLTQATTAYLIYAPFLADESQFLPEALLIHLQETQFESRLVARDPI
jgi:hypothetical protein